ncbi:hypothetical protein L198_07294 [Cryptococcus wingfieldii CBS 7118]|uniref:Protein regulator of cytokinesis 1 n=1 Tax=Cryptococcus wingfieldii CBS 7118 TaxID=1295528 RepID=A0A1E3IDG3_9TREE|nr:hypothetical protein L198_07294 [Cryptococcus wingfieldii CBS 7118]ODN86599.1 hypothetical protein L198_07294 [Cryptococcus wingfieldii CBS 7118]
MSQYLDEQTPHLRHLHAQLALPSSDLDADLARIEQAIKQVITGIIREREAQVDVLKDDIEGRKRDVAGLGRAVGERGRRGGEVGRREGEEGEGETLPRQLERLDEQADQLKRIYDERLAHVQTQHQTLSHLSTLLGPPFQPPAPLQPIASSSKSYQHQHQHQHTEGEAGVERERKKPRETIAQAIANGHQHQTQGKGQGGEKGVWYDVGEGVSDELDTAETRRKNLCQAFFNLTWLHSELALPPIPTSTPHLFPSHLLPPYEEEESPGLYASYEKLLHRLISQNPLPPGESEDWPEVDSLEGMEDIEPEIPLIEWVDEVTELWAGLKEEHEGRIQEMYNLVEPLWTKLEVDQETMDCFVEMNRGSGDATIAAYEAEYSRLLDLRRASLSSFILSARSTISTLHSTLIYSPPEIALFPALLDENYTEDLLALHEQEIQRLEEEVEGKRELLPKTREWFTLVGEEEELEKNAMDPGRFSRRGGAMLREEKLRKRVNLLKPKIEQELLTLLPRWEEDNGRPFMVAGERVVDKIQMALEEKEMAKEAKKRAKQGLGPLPSTSSPSSASASSSARPLVPSRTVRATPAPAGRSTSTRATATAQSTAMSERQVLGKRGAPGPTPTGHGMAKRTRGEAPSAGVGIGTGTGAGAGAGSMRPPQKSGRSVSTSTYHRPTALHNHHNQSAASPTPFHGHGTVRSVSGPHHSSTTTATAGGMGMMMTGKKTGLGLGGLGLGDGRRPGAAAAGMGVAGRRKSFKPRASVAPPSLGAGAGGGAGGLGGWREEDGNGDGDGGDDDVF